MKILVLLPTESWPGPDLIRGSGLVAAAVDGDEVHAYFEGNLHGAANIVTFADRVSHAAGRMTESYPTTAQVHVPSHAVRVVGVYEPDDGIVSLSSPTDEDLVARWLNVAAVPSEELLTTGVKQQNRRVVKALAATGNPADAEKARHYDRELRTGVFA